MGINRKCVGLIQTIRIKKGLNFIPCSTKKFYSWTIIIPCVSLPVGVTMHVIWKTMHEKITKTSLYGLNQTDRLRAESSLSTVPPSFDIKLPSK
jgi:hypothetical protein